MSGQEYKPYASLTPQQKRNYWWSRVSKNRDFIQKKFKAEVEKYIKAYRHEFSTILPDEVLQNKRFDINIVFPIVKTLIPQLYFKDPQVYIKPRRKKISIPQTQIIVDEATGQEQEVPLRDPVTGEQVVKEYDGPETAFIMQSQLNADIKATKLKKNIKAVLLDAHLTFYGAMKTGFGNDQGTESMGEGAPPAISEDAQENTPYGIRLKPWMVIPDVENFYNQQWTAIEWVVHPANLWNDTRLKNTEQIKGSIQSEKPKNGEYFVDDSCQKTRYFEIYVRPSAEFPEGQYIWLAEEVKNDFIFEDTWPYVAHDGTLITSNPVKFLYFNEDPEGGLPVPDVRQYWPQQKAKNHLHQIMHEYITRALPFVGVDFSRVKNKADLQKALRDGTTPKFVDTSGALPGQIIQAFAHNNLNADFWRLDKITDDDVSRTTGLFKGVYPGSGENVEFSGVAKIIDSGEAVRSGERGDIVYEFLTDILKQWLKYRQIFAAPTNYTVLEGEDYPTEWAGEAVQLQMDLEVKPFSMNYEDPTILRQQWTNLFNLCIGPAAQAAFAAQGAKIDFVSLFQRILMTFSEKDALGFLITGDMKAENQVQRAIQEGMDMLQGAIHQVQPTDNHQVHILLHNLFLQFAPTPETKKVFADAMAAHEQAMMAAVPGGSGGGNAENPNMPVGSAANQEMMKRPPQGREQQMKAALSHSTEPKK